MAHVKSPRFDPSDVVLREKDRELRRTDKPTIVGRRRKGCVIADHARPSLQGPLGAWVWTTTGWEKNLICRAIGPPTTIHTVIHQRSTVTSTGTFLQQVQYEPAAFLEYSCRTGVSVTDPWLTCPHDAPCICGPSRYKLYCHVCH